MSETWGAAFVRAVCIALWLVALAVVSIASVFIGSEWRTNVAAFEADLDPRQRADMEEFPPGQDNVAERVARAREGLAWVNRRFAVNGGICAAFGAVLIGGAFVYWRRSRRAGRLRRRTWILALPLAAGLAVLVVIWLSMILAGSIRG